MKVVRRQDLAHEVLAINSKVDSMTADEAQPSSAQRDGLGS